MESCSIRSRLIFALCFLGNLLFAQTTQSTITGTLKNADDQPIPNAKVYLMTKQDGTSMLSLEKNAQAVSDKDGNFKITFLGQEPLLVAEAMGFERKKLKITQYDNVVVTLLTLEQVAAENKAKEQLNNGNNTESFTVNGVCGMCKKRIEMAAYSVTGIKYANWSADKQALTISFVGSKTIIDVVKEKVAAIGHDAPPFVAEKNVYKSLPKCCKYRDGLKIH